MVVIRPHYAVALGLAAVYVAWRRGLRSAALFPEFYAAGLVGAAYLIMVLLLFPSFLSDTMLKEVTVYTLSKRTAPELLFKPTGLIWMALAALALLYRRQVSASPFAMVAALASAGAFWSYFFQGKGFPYHGYVALALAFLALALAFPKPPRAGLSVPVAMAIGSCIAIVAESATGFWVAATLATMLACALIALAVSFLPERLAFRHVRWTAVSFGMLFLAFGQATAWHQSMWMKDPPFLAEARKLGHPKIALVSPNGNFGEFVADRIGGERWPQHASLLGINDVDYVLQQQGVDQATRQKLEAYRRRQEDLLLADFTEGKPDAIVVEAVWARDHLAEQTLQTILRDYRLVSTVGGENSDSSPPLPLLQFYVREPLVK
jgi:hypothetical protein